MALVEWVPADCDIHFVAGDDWSFTVTVTDTGGGNYAWSGATVTCTISRSGTIVVSPTVTATIDGTLTLSLTDTQTSALAGEYSWKIVVTKSAITRTWVKGKCTVNV